MHATLIFQCFLHATQRYMVRIHMVNFHQELKHIEKQNRDCWTVKWRKEKAKSQGGREFGTVAYDGPYVLWVAWMLESRNDINNRGHSEVPIIHIIDTPEKAPTATFNRRDSSCEFLFPKDLLLHMLFLVLTLSFHPISKYPIRCV